MESKESTTPLHLLPLISIELSPNEQQRASTTLSLQSEHGNIT
jgi:hypothetical protein